jgi:hypothetical protein
MNEYRKELQSIENERDTFIGVFKRFGKKKNYHGYYDPTILLIGIQNKNNEFISDHCWFNLTKRFEKLELKQGDIIGNLSEKEFVEFEDEIEEYF